MLTHICMKDHFNNQVAEFTEVSLLHVVENIAVVFLHHPNINRCNANRFFIAFIFFFLLFSLLLIRLRAYRKKADTWWFSSTALSLYNRAKPLPELIWKLFVVPVWSKSWIMAAINEVKISKSDIQFFWKNNLNKNMVTSNLVKCIIRIMLNGYILYRTESPVCEMK